MPININGNIVNSQIASTLNYKSIVTRGLSIHFDASAKDSYPETGTSWFDLVTSTTGTLQNGPTYSFYIQPNSITASLLNTGSNGGATAGYVLSNTDDGYFACVPAGTGTSLAVADYGTGTTFSNVQNII